MEQELPERSLLMVRSSEETIHIQIVQEVGLTRMMHFLEKLEERGYWIKLKVGMQSVSLLPSIVPGDLPGGFPTTYSAKTVPSVGAGRRTGNAETNLLPQSPVPETEAWASVFCHFLEAWPEHHSVFLLFWLIVWIWQQISVGIYLFILSRLLPDFCSLF